MGLIVIRISLQHGDLLGPIIPQYDCILGFAQFAKVFQHQQKSQARSRQQLIFFSLVGHGKGKANALLQKGQHGILQLCFQRLFVGFQHLGQTLRLLQQQLKFVPVVFLGGGKGRHFIVRRTLALDVFRFVGEPGVEGGAQRRHVRFHQPNGIHPLATLAEREEQILSRPTGSDRMRKDVARFAAVTFRPIGHQGTTKGEQPSMDGRYVLHV
mmetsp:Transcript_15364/g.23368  ORF Transcript_15364/g.23368 Transcript_15364/m.23368 type:complete len:212 (-) Transcript_15364:1253-1888(-)